MKSLFNTKDSENSKKDFLSILESKKKKQLKSLEQVAKELSEKMIEEIKKQFAETKKKFEEEQKSQR